MSSHQVDAGHGNTTAPLYGCSVKQLHPTMQVLAARTAVERNPANRPRTRGLSTVLTPDAMAEIMKPEAIALLTTKYWGTGGVKLGVAFVENTVSDLQNKILSHMNAWSTVAGANVLFQLSSLSNAQVRISRGPGGYWSYLGTDVLHIPKDQQTMNLEGFVLKTPDSEYARVVRHETGHTLGFPHEHLRAALVALLDEQKTLSYFEQTQGWSAQEVRDQVLTPITEASLLSPTSVDAQSIMCYQLPGSITKSGQPIPGGTDIDAIDAAYASKMYPKPAAPPPPVVNPPVNPPVVSVGGVVSVDLAAKAVTAPVGWTLRQG